MRKPYRLGDLTGYHLKALDGEIGRLEQVYFDDRRWLVRYFIVRTGSWLLGRRVLIVPQSISGIDEQAKSLDVDLSREQIENCPPVHSERPVSRHYEQQYYRYYGWQPYWTGDPDFGPGTVLPPAGGKPQEPEQPHLRSSAEVTGYTISASDGHIGHVEDFIIEQPDWAVRFLEVDTRNWLPGKHVLLAPVWIKQIDWATEQVSVELSREAIESAPAYDPADVISREYQVSLYAHYGRKFSED